MKKPAISSAVPLSSRLRFLDAGAFLLCAAIVAGRCQVHEVLFSIRQIRTAPETIIGSGSPADVMVMTGLIFILAAVWLLVRLKLGALPRLPRGMSFGWLLLFAAAVISTAVASNKHDAIVASANLLGGLLLGLWCRLLITNEARRRFLLCVLAATGAVSAYRCWEQVYHELPVTMESYRQNSTQMLAAQGIQPGTYAARQFEERLYSQDIGGFFSISNSAAACFLLTIGAAAALLARSLSHPPRGQQWFWFFLGALLLLAQIGGLLLTQSKGGIGAFFLFLLMAAAFIALGRLFWRYRYPMLLAAGVLILAAVSAIAFYGTTHHRLPTASMWVRWQYWSAAAAMIRDHWLTGVGGENFGAYYTQYLDPAAPEVVKDPHSFPIALWSQWGVLGLFGFLICIAAPLLSLLRPKPTDAARAGDVEPGHSAPTSLLVRWWIPAGLLVLAGAVAIRVFMTDLSACTSELERHSVYLISFMVPAFIWFVCFSLAWRSSFGSAPSGLARETILIVCTVLAFIIHNCIDFAIFQPGILCAFAALLSCLSLNQTPPSAPTFLAPRQRWIAAAVILAGLAALGRWIIFPICQSDRLLRQTERLAAYRLDEAIALAQRAAAINPLDPKPPAFAAQLAYTGWLAEPAQTAYFQQASAFFQQARRRDPVDAFYPQKLADLYTDAAQYWSEPDYDRQAARFFQEALERYPGKGELLIKAGQNLQRLGEADQARLYFQKAWDIEQAFQEQQHAMWRGAKPVLPRLHPDMLRQLQENLQQTAAPKNP